MSAGHRATTLGMPRWLAILLVSLAGLLLEVGYTRIVSYKLWYYYTYLVIGLALLGIGSGSVFVVVCAPVRRWATERIIAVCVDLGRDQHRDRLPRRRRAARQHGRDLGLRDRGRRSRTCCGSASICFAIFATFIAFGVIVVGAPRAGRRRRRPHLLRRPRRRRPRLPARDPADHAARPAARHHARGARVRAGRRWLSCRAEVGARSASPAVTSIVLVDHRGRGAASCPTSAPRTASCTRPVASTRAWGPVFRVDVVQARRATTLELPAGARRHVRFRHPPLRRQPRVDRALLRQGPALAPVRRARRRRRRTSSSSARRAATRSSRRSRTTRPTSKRSSSTRSRSSLLTTNKNFADYTGHLADRPDVHLHQGDGRSYLARHNTKYDLVWYVAPDSYAATNAASSGAFVLSESYLYTTRDDRRDAAAPHRRRHHGRAVRRAELPRRAEPHEPLRRHRAQGARGARHQAIPTQHLLVGRAAHATSATSRRSCEAHAVHAGRGRPVPRAASHKLPDQHPIAAPGHDFGTQAS